MAKFEFSVALELEITLSEEEELIAALELEDVDDSASGFFDEDISADVFLPQERRVNGNRPNNNRFFFFIFFTPR